MDDQQNIGKIQEPGNEKQTNIIDKTIAAIIHFVIDCLYTMWVFVRWPFRRPPDVLDEDNQKRYLSPYSFLFICSSIFFFAGERLFKIIDYATVMTMIRTKQFGLFPELSKSNYSLESYAFKTAPILAIIIVIAYMTAWIKSARNDLLKRKIIAAVCYLSGYKLLLISALTFSVVFSISRIYTEVNLPGQPMSGASVSAWGKMIETIGPYVFQIGTYVIIVYFIITLFMILFSFSKAISQQIYNGWKRVTSIGICFLTLFFSIVVALSLSLATTSYQISGHFNPMSRVNVFPAGEGLTGVAVISNDKKAIEKNELPFSIAISNISDKAILLFAFRKVAAIVNIGSIPPNEFHCRFAPRLSSEKFIELKPNATVVIDGVLTNTEKNDFQANLLISARNTWTIKIEMFFWGIYPRDGITEIFDIDIEKKKEQTTGKILFAGFEPIAAVKR